MNLYKITSEHYGPKDLHESMLGFVLAENDEQIYNYLRSEPKINGYSIYNSWSYYDNKEESEEYIENFKELVIQAKSDNIEKLEHLHTDAYYGLTCFGWELCKENLQSKDIDVLLKLNIVSKAVINN